MTQRQREILERLQSGMKPADVGEDLGISTNAVYQHITSLKRAGVMPDKRRHLAALPEDPMDAARNAVAAAQRRIEEITEQETQLKEERAQLEAFIKRNRDLVPA